MTKKKKMCKYWNNGKPCALCGGKRSCPSNTRFDTCELIPAKPKVRKLKSMANIDWDSGCYIVNATNVQPKYFGGAFNVPCTITIESKYLKEKRK